MNSEILEIAHHLETQVQKIFSLLEKKRKLEDKEREITLKLEDVDLNISKIK